MCSVQLPAKMSWVCQTGSTPVRGFGIQTNREVVCELAGPLAALIAAIMLCMYGCWQLVIDERSLVPQGNVTSPFRALILFSVLGRGRALQGILLMLIGQARGKADGPQVHVTYGRIANTLDHLHTQVRYLCILQAV